LRIKAIRIRTSYWRPGTDHVREITSAISDIVQDGDIVAVSEKAIAVSSRLIIDESLIRASSLARVIASLWMRKIWGGPLGRLAKLREKTNLRLREFPLEAGAVHKQTAIRRVGFMQALRHYSEGGIDASNLPYSYVSLPLDEPSLVAERIRSSLESGTGRRLTVMIVDGDTTHSWRNLHLAPRRVDVIGLIHFGGFLTFVLGRMLGLKERSTPLAVSGMVLNPDLCLTFANVAHRVRGYGAGRTVWDMAERMGVDISRITWEMLERVEHFPVVIIREIER